MIREIILAHAADIEHGRNRAADVRDHEARDMTLQIRRIGQSERIELVTAERSDRDSHVLDALLSLLSGDSDLVDDLCRDWRRDCRDTEQNQNSGSNAGSAIQTHGYSPSESSFYSNIECKPSKYSKSTRAAASDWSG